MRGRFFFWPLLIVVAGFGLYGCSDDAVVCSSQSDCAADEVCFDGICEEGEPGDFNITEPTNNGEDNDNNREDCPSDGCRGRLFTQNTVIFHDVAPQATYTEVTFVENYGEDPFVVDDVAITSGSDFEVTFPDGRNEDGSFPPRDEDATSIDGATVEPGEMMYLRVWFTPEDDEPSDGTMTIYSDVAGDEEVEVNLVGNYRPGCMQTSASEGIDFGAVTIGESAQRTVTITNCSLSGELEIHALAISESADGAYSIREDSYPGDLPGSVLKLEAKQTVTFVVEYSPEDEEVDEGELLLSTTDQHFPQLRAPLTGHGSTEACPTAEIEVFGQTVADGEVEVRPLETVELSGQASSHPDGAAIEEYQWALIDKPAPAHPLVDFFSPAQVSPELFVDVGGTYRVELNVVDAEGNSSCSPAVVDLKAVPDGDIYLELTWHPVFTTDTERGEGTDVRLHYVHPNGDWGSPEWSIFQSVAKEDEPPRSWDGGHVEMVSTDMWGEFPETIRHDAPQEGLFYDVGAYFNYDFTMGTTDATLRVFFDGILAFEHADRRLYELGELWYAGQVEWGDEPQFYEVDEILVDHQAPSEPVSWPPE